MTTMAAAGPEGGEGPPLAPLAPASSALSWCIGEPGPAGPTDTDNTRGGDGYAYPDSAAASGLPPPPPAMRCRGEAADSGECCCCRGEGPGPALSCKAAGAVNEKWCGPVAAAAPAGPPLGRLGESCLGSVIGRGENARPLRSRLQCDKQAERLQAR